jgi:uncharacterized protein YejL (UPF0352 family)
LFSRRCRERKGSLVRVDNIALRYAGGATLVRCDALSNMSRNLVASHVCAARRQALAGCTDQRQPGCAAMPLSNMSRNLVASHVCAARRYAAGVDVGDGTPSATKAR